MAKKDLTANGLVILIGGAAPEAHEGLIAEFLKDFEELIILDANKQIVALEKQLTAKDLILVEADKSIVAFKANIHEINLNSKQEIDRLTAECVSLASLKSQITSVTAERDTALGMVKEMSEQIALQSEVKDANTLIVSIEGEKYKLQGGKFTVPGHGKLTLAELSKNEDALIVMKDRQSGALTKMEK
ncbi:MAG: hypothetical protein H7Y13_11910 [Sphingobacteriaceae bacterium]|nr:hypothetical protein [Sphingobacteriaceae bacterium]